MMTVGFKAPFRSEAAAAAAAADGGRERPDVESNDADTSSKAIVDADASIVGGSVQCCVWKIKMITYWDQNLISDNVVTAEAYLRDGVTSIFQTRSNCC